MKILGISAYYHDAAAALLIDGQVVAAAQEERFTRRKHDSSFPHHAIRACLEATGTRASEIDYVAFYDKPFLKFERLLETYLAFAPRGFASFRTALPVWVKDEPDSTVRFWNWKLPVPLPLRATLFCAVRLA